MTIKTKKIVNFIPFAGFFLVLAWEYFLWKNHVKKSQRILQGLVLAGICVLNYLASRLVIYFLEPSSLPGQVITIIMDYLCFFMWGIVVIKHEEKYLRENK